MPLDPQDPRRQRLREIIAAKAVLRGDFTLASGQRSTIYFDGRKVTNDAEGVALVGALVEEIAQEAKAEAIGGPATGAIPIVTAAQIASYQRRRALPGFYVRSERKAHGTGQLIEGNLPTAKGARVAVVEDAITTGGSLLKAIEAIEAAGCKVAKVIVMVDRQQGGVENLRSKGYDVEALFKADGQGRIE